LFTDGIRASHMTSKSSVSNIPSNFFRSAKGFKDSLTSSEDKFYQHCNKAFGTWDFALSDVKNVALKKKSIYNEIVVRLFIGHQWVSL